MTDWEPATEAEAAMRDALRANNQELYFRVLARTDLLLPVSAEALAGQAPMGWGTWTTGDRTHVLAFTSPAALQACLGGSPAASRRSAYADLAADWPNHEWWLAVNPGLPIEGYLPAWFVSQLSRGDVRLPGRTMGARARLERAENVARTRATAAVPGRDVPVPGQQAPGAPSGRPTTEPFTATPPAITPPEPAPPASSYRSSAEANGPATARPYGDARAGAEVRPVSTGPRAGEPADGATAAADPVPSGSGWLNVPRRRTPEVAPAGESASGNGRPVERPAPPTSPTPPASFFEPASGRNRAGRPIGEPRRPVERAAPPSRFAGGGQPFPRRRPASDAPEQPPQGFRPTAAAEPPTVAVPAAPPAELFQPDGAGADEVTHAFRPGGVGADEVTRAFRPGGVGADEVTRAFRPGGGRPDEATQALRTGVFGSGEATRAFRPGDAARTFRTGAAGSEEATQPLRAGVGVSPEPPRPSPQDEATRAFRSAAPDDEPTRPFGVTGDAVADEPTRPLGRNGGAEPTRPSGRSGAGTGGELPPRRPGAGAAQAFPRPRPGAADEEPTRFVPEQPVAGPGEEVAEDLHTLDEPASVPSSSRRPFSPIVIEGTIIESRDMPATEPFAAPGPAPAAPVFGGPRPAAPAPGATPAPDHGRPDQLPHPGPGVFSQGDLDREFGGLGPAQVDFDRVESHPVPPSEARDDAGADSAPPVTGGPGPAASLFTLSAPPAPGPSAESLFRPTLSAADAGADAGPDAGVMPTEPAVAEPMVAKPAVAEPIVAKPAVAEPMVAKPAVAEPIVAEPAVGGAAGPEPEPTAPAPDFQPANEVEEDLLAAAGTGSTDTFLSTLLLARVLLPVAPDSAPDSRPGDPGFVWRTEQLDGETYVVVHTSPERLADHVDEPVETVRVKFVQLIRRWPDDAWSFAVNPNTPVGAKLPGEQIVALANWAAEVGLGDDAGSEPEPPAAEVFTQTSRHVPPPVDPNRPVVMQKAIAPSQLSYYLERGYDRVSGFVHRANELAHLSTPVELHAALGLGYPDSPFFEDAEQIYVLRWPAHRPSLYRIPYGGQNEGAMRAMEGWVIERPPFRGNGFAPGESSDVVAEFKVDSARLPHGAELWRIGADGTERVVAILDTDALLWRRVGES
ncbi:SseB family protein [Micromonospora sp. RTGN7]|uniref:SseB family protein n=1 Tax=Micromonospora sp. RTGN7 TaxID=3016526 RepID=UPI0029FF1F5F|nr:SseB family protein [Micromonospora sp. RTGN7]